jgi:hypothetical protein
MQSQCKYMQWRLIALFSLGALLLNGVAVSGSLISISAEPSAIPARESTQRPRFDHLRAQNIFLEKAIDLLGVAANSIIVEAVQVQNAAKLTKDEILRRDREWLSSDELTPFKLSLQKNSAGVLLKEMVDRNGTMFNEAFLTDNQGANVAAYPATTDYWQGDEDKFIISYNQGEGQLLISPVTYDNSSNTWASQVAVPIYDIANETIGVLFVGIRLSYTHAGNANKE